MRYARGRSRRGFTLLELMIATAVMAIVFMGFLSSLTGSFLASNSAKMASTAHATARRIMEELLELDYGDLLLTDGNTMLLQDDGLAAKVRVYESGTHLLTVEVDVCRPAQAMTLSQLAALSFDEFDRMDAMHGMRVRFTTLSGGAHPVAETTRVTESPSSSKVAGPSGG